MSAYRAPAGSATGELREKGSRFVALVAPARTESEAREVLDGVRRAEPGATHHCWAWRLGRAGLERYSDDGEPSGTAGAPMLQVLRGEGLSDVVVVVTRWFGGTKLGKGGLARAYAGAVKSALERLMIEERWPTVEIACELPYQRVGALKRLIRPPEVVLVEEEYGATARMRLVVRLDRVAEIEESLTRLGAARLDGGVPTDYT